MLKEEKRFQFRERLSQVHPLGIRDWETHTEEDEFELPDGAVTFPEIMLKRC